MTNKKLLMFALAGAAIVPAADQGIATAAPKGARVIIPAPVNDTAPVGGSPMPRLRRTDEEQPGNEMTAFWVARDPAGKVLPQGLYFAATTELNGVRAARRMQGALVPVRLEQLPDGTIQGVADLANPNTRFITNNTQTNEYRNFNNATIGDIVGPGGEHYAYLEYNVQLNNSNDTKRYAQIFRADGTRVMDQTVVFQNNNDDCSMHQDGDSVAIAPGTAPNTARVFGYRGCNGNGDDAGFVSGATVTFSSPTSASLTRDFDVLVCDREERSRGAVRITADGKAVIASWTEGNTQPQRDGVWMAAVDLTKNPQGKKAQRALAWKQQIDGRVDQDGIRTYSMRMKMEQITDQTGIPTNRFLIQYGALRGNNNTNGKGGTYYRSMVGMVEADVTGLKFLINPVDVAGPRQAMDGLEGTHLGQVYGMFGTAGAATPGIAFLSGSHFGGANQSEIRIVTVDEATGTFKNAGSLAGAPHDRHLYSNYLGNNPGNQGRNHSHGQIIENPFLGQNGSTATQLLVYATSAKDTGNAGGATTSQLLSPEIKLAAWLTIIPVQSQAAEPDPNPNPNPDPNPNPEPDPTGGDDTGPGAAGESLGGCSTGGSTGLATFFLIGLAAFIRRRR